MMLCPIHLASLCSIPEIQPLKKGTLATGCDGQEDGDDSAANRPN